ncbi:hypothetical protein HDV00_011569 [Rhizophlyctis rosea]|nr:hypothetical protein HDV00_011569 [Rhizophlyctis rosea]
MNIPQTLLSIPPVTRVTLLLVPVLSFVSYYQIQLSNGTNNATPIFTVTPSASIPYIWSFITAGWVESNIVSLVTNVVILAFAGIYFEQAWGRREFTKFIFIVPTAAYILVFFFLFLEYAVGLNTSYLYLQANGLGALLTAFLIAFKQIIPEHTLKIASGAVSVRVKHLPSTLLLLITILFIIRLIHVNFFIILSGAVTSWIYLRFYKQQDGNIRGDRSEAFSFVSFWPDFMHPILKPFSSALYAVCIRLKIVPKNPQDGALPTHTRHGAAAAGTGTAGMSTDISDAERRRALALKALDMHLSQAPSVSSSSSRPSTPAPN